MVLIFMEIPVMTNKVKLLIIDDEEYVSKILKAMLVKEGYSIFYLNSGDDILNKLSDINPDVILLDVIMPGMDGFEVCKRIKTSDKWSYVPIIMLSALDSKEDVVKGLTSGAEEFISKPVRGIELKARIRTMLKIKAYNDHMHFYQQDLEDMVEKRTSQFKNALEQVKEASRETAYRLSKAAEYRDEDTGSHIQRMSYYSAVIARQMGFDDEFIDTLLYAAPMHDVGKIGIPDNILLKHGSLTEKEWDIMKQHTHIGANILHGSDSEYLKLAETIALTHHEKWNGTGYPNGLVKDQIPVVGRITAVADVFDALISKRPYKSPVSLEESFDIIKQGSGKDFDPQIVDAFLDVKTEIIKIKDDFKDNGKSHLKKKTDSN